MVICFCLSAKYALTSFQYERLINYGILNEMTFFNFELKNNRFNYHFHTLELNEYLCCWKLYNWIVNQDIAGIITYYNI
jgi:hypothetical protein